MKFKKIFSMALVGVMTMGVVSCSDDGKTDEPLMATDAKDDAFKKIATQYLDNTVLPTYESLAESAARLVDELATLREAKTDANVRKVCETFLVARAWWEKSEAFLFGPASDFGIDPHIDSWPLDRAGLQNQMDQSSHLEAMEAEDGDVWAGTHLGPELLGFHGIEYIIFADGAPKSASMIPDSELTYAIAVVGDLRNKCWQLLLSWAGEDYVGEEMLKKVVEELEWPITISGVSYKENMLNAGNAGSTYRTWTDAMEAIVDGCIDITDEVGTMKIGKPYSGEDVNYIESPYSHKSITDFYDNMVSVENAYMGGIEGHRNETLSLHAYIKSVDPVLDAKCTEAICNVKEKISSMAAPFVKNFSDPSAKAASDACGELADVLTEVKAALSK